MDDLSTTLRLSLDLPLAPDVAFGHIVGELMTALSERGLDVTSGPQGRLTRDGHEVGQIAEWQPDEGVRLRWQPAEWQAQEPAEIDLRVEPFGGGTRVSISLIGWDRQVSDPVELAGWLATAVTAPLVLATSSVGFGDWLTDRRARHPSGAQAREVYGDPIYHYPNFLAILAELALTADDVLLEVGCGGGKLLRAALESGCRAMAIDHSLEMVRLAQEVNADAIAAGRAVIALASADELPFADAACTCAVMTGVLGFLSEPVAALREMRRVLVPGGRMIVLCSDPALRGTPAAPEPMASRLRFYSDEEHVRLAVQAGFDEAQVVRRDLEPFARQAGVPEEHIGLFAGDGTPFLVARKD